MTTPNSSETRYWLVGASWGGVEHQDERFVQDGFWMLGWEQGHQPERAAEIASGDRIAIKRMMGQGQSSLRIMHIGIVRGVVHDTNKVICTVHWAATHLDRVIQESRGCFKSVHGPYTKSDPATTHWIEEVFCL